MDVFVSLVSREFRKDEAGTVGEVAVDEDPDRPSSGSCSRALLFVLTEADTLVAVETEVAGVAGAESGEPPR